MEKRLKKCVKIWHYLSGMYVVGPHPRLYGDTSTLFGDVSNIQGDATGVYGPTTGFSGDLDKCQLTQAERDNGVYIGSLVGESEDV